MPTDYNAIAARYQQAKTQPWREHVELYTLLDLLGDLSGREVLDLACGEGFLTRAVRQRGAARVVGVDVSEKMVDLARQREAREPLGIDYLVQDARQVDAGKFDVVTAGYLLNYARDRDELLAMCRAIAGSLRPGGRFISVNNNPAQPAEDFAASRKYGFVKLCDSPLEEGAAVVFRFFMDDGALDVTNYHLSAATHSAVFREAGLRNVRWHAPRLSPAGVAEFGTGFWAQFLQSPPVIFIECAK
jgi:SAM-dependent methyltransferase